MNSQIVQELILVGVVVLSGTAALAAFPTDRGTITIGGLADFSGPTADVGTPYGQGVADMIAYVNQHSGVGGKRFEAETVDYSYQVPRAVAACKDFSSRVVAIQGWGTADTEALSALVAKDKIPYYSASYAAALTDPVGGASANPSRA